MSTNFLRNYGPWILAVVLVLCALYGLYALWASQKGTSQRNGAGLGAEVASISGDVKFLRDGVELSVKVGDEVRQGDEIQTGAESEASLEFFSGARVALDEKTHVEIMEAMMDSANWKKQNVKLKMTSGRVWSRILKLLDVESSYGVSSNRIVTNVRGTAYLMRTPAEGVEAMDVFDGVVDVGTSYNKTESMYPGTSILFTPGKLPPTIFDAVFITPDEIRNDHWVRAQLKADEDFAKRANAEREDRGASQDISSIGHEAGPFTLDVQPHSNYRGVELVVPSEARTLSPGSTTQLQAFALFETTSGIERRDVTSQATWVIQDPSRATIAQGRLDVSPQALPGILHVGARFNDGTHEHSAITDLNISSGLQVDTHVDLIIQ
jgi:hypothetical protein